MTRPLGNGKLEEVMGSLTGLPTAFYFPFPFPLKGMGSLRPGWPCLVVMYIDNNKREGSHLGM